MKNNNSIRWGRIVFLLALIAVSGTAWALLSSEMDAFIIEFGVAAYRMVITGAKYLFFILIGLSAGTGIYEVKRYHDILLQDAKKRDEIESQQQQAVLEQKNRDSFLAASGKLSEKTIRDEVSAAVNGQWYFLEDKLSPLIKQSNRMDEYQNRLAELLRKNGADKLDDAEDVLDRAEQEMLRNIRKVINYIEIGIPEQKDSVERIISAAGTCLNKNDRLLGDTSAFLVALTDYLNSQGDDSDAAQEALESYRDILIKSTSGRN